MKMKQQSTKKTAKLTADRENPEWTREDFSRAVTFDRLPADVVKAFRGSGAGWQSRVDDILRAYIK